jgi:hypothetical protein
MPVYPGAQGHASRRHCFLLYARTMLQIERLWYVPAIPIMESSSGPPKFNRRFDTLSISLDFSTQLGELFLLKSRVSGVYLRTCAMTCGRQVLERRCKDSEGRRSGKTELPEQRKAAASYGNNL